VAGILSNPSRDWSAIAKRNGGVRVASEKRALDVDWKKFNIEDFLFNHCSIVTSVATASNGYWIEPPCHELVNANGNAWTTPVLMATFKSFCGAENYYEHVQVPELSKGKILDAVLRPVVHVGRDGKKAEVMICDILVATSRIHSDIVDRILNNELTTMSMGCGLFGTLVTMSDGTRKRIEDIGAGEMVFTHKGSIKKVTKPVKTIWNGDLYSLKLDGRPESLDFTGNHRFFVASGIKECLCGCGEELPDGNLGSCFIKGHKVRVLNPMKKYSSEERMSIVKKIDTAKKLKGEWKALRDIKAGDYILTPVAQDSNSDYWMTEETARLLGLFLAEGCYRKVEDEYVAVEFSYSLSELDTLAKETADLLESEFGVKSSIYTREDCNQCVVRSVVDREVVAWFMENAGNYSHSKVLQEKIFQLPKSVLLSLFGGWFDGDGCCDFKNRSRLSGSTVSKRLAEQLDLLLFRCGIYHSYKITPTKIGKTDLIQRMAVHHLTIPSSEAYKLDGFSNKVIIRDIEKRTRWDFVDDYVMVRVKSNDQVRDIADNNIQIDVYCLEVEDDHSFLVGNVSAENCVAHVVTCSRCGKELSDDNDSCPHLENELMQEFVDKNGVRRIVAELCGRTYMKDGVLVGDPDSLEFIEASWVERPAYKGAVLNYMISEPTKKQASILQMSTKNLSSLFEDVLHMRVADTEGMMVLRVARAEILRRNREDIISRVASIVL